MVATGNVGKLSEFRALFSNRPDIELIAQGDLGIESCEEPASTFVENAILKARHACAEASRLGHGVLPALADDSGLALAALGGAPGIYSARFAELEKYTGHSDEPKDTRNNHCLLHKLRESGSADRRASFYCALALLRHADDPVPLIAVGRWQGEILEAPRGGKGFGYDPLFRVAGADYTAAEMSSEAKNAVSHRGRAIRQLAALLDVPLGGL